MRVKLRKLVIEWSGLVLLACNLAGSSLWPYLAKSSYSWGSFLSFTLLLTSDYLKKAFRCLLYLGCSSSSLSSATRCPLLKLLCLDFLQWFPDRLFSSDLSLHIFLIFHFYQLFHFLVILILPLFHLNLLSSFCDTNCSVVYIFTIPVGCDMEQANFTTYCITSIDVRVYSFKGLSRLVYCLDCTSYIFYA